jgi:ABC-type branched-subunit amino acid transport system substrate-binding protein
MHGHGMRKALACLAVLAFAATACGGSDNKTTGTTAAGGAKSLTAVPGFDPATNTIKVGIITPLTGAVAAIGKPLTAGNEVFFSKVNAKGGIAGKYKIEYVERDSAYNPQQAVQAYNELKSQVVMFAQILGTPSTKAVLTGLKADGMVAAPASLDADWVREPNLLPIGGPYQIQAINALTWYVTEGTGKGKKICSMASDDAYGQAGVQGVDFAAEKNAFKLATKQTFTTGKGAEATAAVQGLKDAGCEAVFIVSTPSDTGAILGIAAKTAFAPQWIGQSPSYIGALSQSPLKDYLAKNFMVVAEGTEWGDTTVPGMKNLLDDITKFKADQAPDYYFSFGYNEANAVVQVLEKAVALGDLSHAGIMKAMEGVGTLTFDGLTGDYKYGKAADRVPPRESTLFKVDPTKPIGLALVKKSFSTDAAKAYKIA